MSLEGQVRTVTQITRDLKELCVCFTGAPPCLYCEARLQIEAQDRTLRLLSSSGVRSVNGELARGLEQLREHVRATPAFASVNDALLAMDSTTTRDILLLALRSEQIGYVKGIAYSLAQGGGR